VPSLRAVCVEVVLLAGAVEAGLPPQATLLKVTPKRAININFFKLLMIKTSFLLTILL
jgi:hypothetical protein